MGSYAPVGRYSLYNYDSPGSTSIRDLLLMGGQERARAAERAGQMWASTLQDIGNNVGGYIAQQQAKKQQLKQQSDLVQHIQNNWDNPEALASGLVARLGAKPGLDAAKAIETLKKPAEVEPEKEMGAFGLTLNALRDKPADVIQAALPAVKARFGSPGGAADKLGLTSQIPDRWDERYRPILSGLADVALGMSGQKAQPPQLKETAPGASLYDPTTGKFVATAPAKPEMPEKKVSLGPDAAKKLGLAPGEYSPTDIEVAKTAFIQSREDARKAAGSEPDVALGLTDTAVDLAARRYLKDGTLPPMGMGKSGAGTRQRILNRAAQIDPEADIAGAAAGYHADKTSLSKLQTMRDSIGSFENTASKNIDIFLDQAGKVVDTGSPLANKLVRSVSGSILGSPNVKAYDAARQVAVNEVAKITSNPTLSGQLSDTARKEVESFNPENATLAQTVAVMRVLKQDMENRKTSLDASINEIKGRISGKPSTAPKAPAAAPLQRINSEAEFNALAPGTHFIGPDGKEYER